MLSTHDHLEPIDLNKAYRLLNLGATCMVSAEFNGAIDAMPATWVGALDLNPTKCTAVIAKDHYTRPLIEKSGLFAIGIPSVSIAKELLYLGPVSKNDEPQKLEKSGASFFTLGDFKMPLMDGCIGYLIFKVINEPHLQETYDLFLGDIVAAWADTRVYQNNHIDFSKADPLLRSLHYVAGSHFFGLGDELKGEGLGLDEE